MNNKALILLGLVIKYSIIMVIIFILGGIYRPENYGMWIIIYYIAINYLTVKYAVINGFNKRNDIDKSKVFVNCSVLLVISNIIIYSLFKFKIWDLILLSTIPVIMLRIIKTDKEKQKIIDINTKKAIDEYFENKK